MSPVVMDWDRMVLFTDGDPDEEKELIDLFTSCGDEILLTLQQACGSFHNDIWLEAVHKLKGSAANLGAEHLANLCTEVESAKNGGIAVKRALFDKVAAAYKDLCIQLAARIAA